MSEHTPGPWFSIGASIESKSFIIARMFGWNEARKTEEGQANARLIAAAPELLKALKSLVSIEINGVESDKQIIAKKIIEKVENHD